MRVCVAGLLVSLALLSAGPVSTRNPIPNKPAASSVGPVLKSPFDRAAVRAAITQRLRPRMRGRSLGPTLPTGEFLIDSVPALGPSPYSQDLPSASFDGTNYFVVWQDSRDNRIRGTRVNAAGQVVDSSGIAVSPEFVTAYGPSVAFDGTNYLVAWHTISMSYDTLYVFCARVTPGGTVLDPGGILVNGSPYPMSEYNQVAIARQDTVCLLAWEDYRADPYYSDIYAARVNRAGDVLDPAGIRVSRSDSSEVKPAVAALGGVFLVAWEDRRLEFDASIYAARISLAGVVLDTSGIVVSADSNAQGSPGASADGANFLVTWDDDRDFPYTDIYCARVSTAGAVLDPAGIPVSTALYRQRHPAAAFDGTNYVLIWDDSRIGRAAVYAARVTPDGTVLDPDGFVVALPVGFFSAEAFPRLASGSGNLLAVWMDGRDTISYIPQAFAARISRAGVVIDTNGIALGGSVNEQVYASAGSDGTNYLVVWADHRSSAGIYGARIGPNGERLAPGAFAICTTAVQPFLPTVTFDGTNYLVAWCQLGDGYFDIYATRVAPDATVLDPNGIAVCTAYNDQVMPVAASCGGNSMIAWSDYRSEMWPAVYAARIAPDGAVLDPDGFSLYADTMPRAYPSITSGGGNYQLAWADGRVSVEEADLYGARVAPDGTILDTGGFVINDQPGWQLYSAAATSDNQHCVAWISTTPGGNDYSIGAARVAFNGKVLDSAGIQVTGPVGSLNLVSLPAAAFDGSRYVIAWLDTAHAPEGDIYGASVTTWGTVGDTFPVVTQAGLQAYPALAASGNHRLLAAYTGWADTVNGHSFGVFRTWGKLGPFGGVAEPGARDATMTTALAIEPNPVRSRATVSYSVRTDARVDLAVCDVTGRRVRTLVSGRQRAGEYQALWDARDDAQRRLPEGVYFVQLKSPERSLSRKVIVTR